MQTRAFIITVVFGFLAGSVLVAHAADHERPAEFTVSNTIVQEDKFLFTATIGRLPTDTIGFGSFEPFVFRNKWELREDAENNLPIPHDSWRAYRMFKDGFWDGARVRIYRIRDGRFVKIRDDQIAEGGHASSGWLPVRLGRDWDNLINPNSTTARLNIGGGWRMDVPYWYRVVAVHRDGAVGPGSAAVTITPPGPSRGRTELDTVAVAGHMDWPEDAAIGAPQGVRAELDGEGGLLLSWQRIPGEDVAGYRIEISDTNPAKHRGFHLRLAGQAGQGGQEALKAGDIAFISKQFTDYSRQRYVRHTMFNAREIGNLMSARPRTNGFVKFFGDEEEGRRWRLVPHPGPLPDDFADGGETCLELTLDEGKEADILVGRHSGTHQGWYVILRPDTDYVLEARIRTQVPNARVAFYYSSTAEPLILHPDDSWKLHTVTFNSGAKGSLLGRSIELMQLRFTGPGAFWVDNVRLYPEDSGFMSPTPVGVERAREADLHAVRYHNHIKSGFSHTMQMLTNPPGVVGKQGARTSMNPDTLPGLLAFTRKIESNPWLQIEMCMSEEEWLGLVEYLAAPYDPAVDTPEDKPWAYKRYAQGQRRPWVEEFEKIYFEISNETWNWSFNPWIFYPGHVDEVTGRSLNRGEVYGLLHTYVMNVLRSSPYWTDELEVKWEDVLGGWATEATDAFGGYGPQAAFGAPEADHLTVAAYNGGWDAGEPAAEMTDESLFRSATFFLQYEERVTGTLDVRAWQIAAGLVPFYEYGTYEAGPGYTLPGSVSKEQVEAQSQVGKSLATGIATLDAFVGRAAAGYKLQNFFTMSFGRSHWTSFAPIHQGGHPYPSWIGLTLFNSEGRGDFLGVETLSVPTADLPAYVRRPERRDAPLVGVYPTVRGDRVNVLILSRKIDGVLDENDDGWTPVAVNLPFTSARNVTLHRLTGDPRWHNLDEYKIRVETMANVPFESPEFRLESDVTGLERDGLPPGALLFVFEGTDISINHAPRVTPVSPVQATLGQWIPLDVRADDPDGDSVEISWELGDAGEYDSDTGRARLTRSGQHKVCAVADDGRGGRTRALCLVDAAVPVGGHRWVFSDLSHMVDGPGLEATGDGLTITCRGTFRQAPWAYIDDARLPDKAAVTLRLSSETPDRQRIIAGISLRDTPHDWSLWRTPHVTLVASGPSGDGELKVLMDDERRMNQNAGLFEKGGLELPLWLRIVRDGNRYVGLVSSDGVKWEEVGEIDGPQRPLPGELYVGVICGTGGGRTTTIQVDNVDVHSTR